METLNLETNLDTVDLTRLVGVILVRGMHLPAVAPLAREIEEWIHENSWENHLRLCLELGNAVAEIRFIPGEHQSNPEMRLMFRDIPNFSKIQSQLERWLYELM